MSIRNDLIGRIIFALGGTATEETRNGLLRQWLELLQNRRPNLYLNPGFAAGGKVEWLAGDADTPPNFHAWNFADTNALLVGSGVMEINTGAVTGRRSLSYLFETNHPGVQVGEVYRISYTCETLVGSSLGGLVLALAGNGDNIATVIASDAVIAPLGQSKTVFIDFEIASAYTGSNFRLRAGVGPNSNDDFSVRLSDAKLIKLA